VRRSVALVGLLAVSTAARAVTPVAVVAWVEGKPVTQTELEDAAKTSSPYGVKILENPVARRQLLDRLIETRILAADGAQRGYDQDAAFKERVEAARAKILAQVATDRAVEGKLNDAAIAAYFAAHKERYGSREVKVAHIVLPDAAKAKAVLALAKAPGADFAALAKQHGTGPGAKSGGEIGWIGRGRMIPEFETAAFATPKGEVAKEVVRTTFGYHVIKVEDVRGRDDAQLEDVKQRVREDLEHDVRAAYVAELKAKAKVVVVP
jgi:peptidyl-prolyl cis-trans isomerase C